MRQLGAALQNERADGCEGEWSPRPAASQGERFLIFH